MDITQMTNSTQIIAYALQGAVGAAQQAKDFVVEQAPDVIRQLIAFNVAKDICLVILFLILFIGSIFLARYAYKEEDSPKSMWIVVPLFICTPMFVAMCVNIFDLLKILIAPKIWLIEYAASLVK